MKKYIYLLLLIPFLPNNLPAQSLVNSGADITIKSGSALKINGKLIHKSDGHILNNGTINLDGDWYMLSGTPVFLPGSAGELKFTGNTQHLIDGVYGLDVPNLTIETDVGLINWVVVSNHLQFNNAKFFMTWYDFTIGENATISGYGPDSYFVCSGGSVFFPVHATEMTIPIGTNSGYLPLTAKNNNGNGQIGVFLNQDVQVNGGYGGTIPEIEQTVKHTWEMSYWGFPSTPDLDLTFQWPGNVEGSSFNSSTTALSHYNGSVWSFFPIQEAQGSDPFELTQTGISEPGYFTIWSKQPELITLDLKVYLEGAYNTASNQMDNILAELNYLPLDQPYNPTLPYYNENNPVWFYTGTESVGSIPPYVVDWVIIQVRDADAPENAGSSSIIGQQAAFLLNNGSVVDLDGFSFPEVFSVISRNLYVVVFHRNHLGVISANPITDVGGIYSYNFTSGSGQAFGGINGHKQLEPGVWGMVAGDGNGNGLIQNTDETSVWKTDLGQSGYKGGDFNLNGLVQNTDETNYWKVNLGAGGQTPGKSNRTGYKSQVPE